MPSGYLTGYLEDLRKIASSVDMAEFEDLVAELRDGYERESNIFICGNGGSSATAAHFACDMNKMIAPAGGRRFKLMCLSSNVPIILAYANDVSYEHVFVEQLKNFMRKDDLVICISGSGNSPNVLKAIEYANVNGARTFGIAGFGGGKMKSVAAKSIVVDSWDMQKVEDMHMILLHCALQYLCRETRS